MGLASKSFSVLTREIFVFFSTIISSVVIARTLGPEMMGVWITLQILPSYADMFGRPKVDNAAVYFLGKKKYSIGDVSTTLNLIAGVFSALIILLLIANFDFLSDILLKENKTDYSLLLGAILILIPLNFFYLNYYYLHTFKEDAASMNTMVLSKALSFICIAIPGLLIFDFGIRGLLVCTIFSHALPLVFGIYRFNGEARKEQIINVPLIKDLFRYSYKVYFSGILINLNTYLAGSFILILGSTSQIAFFTLAQQFNLILIKTIDAMNTFVFPMTSKINSSEAKKLIARVFRTATVIVIPLSILSALTIYPAIFVFYGSEYLPITAPFLIILVGVAFSSITGTLTMYFMGVDKLGLIFKTFFLPVFVQFVLGYWVVDNYGLTGAAAILSISMILAGFAQLLIFLKHTNLNFLKDLVFTRTDILTVVGFCKRFIYRS